eukprot:6118063-Pyramimonas_sp.AAC.1
MTLTCAAPTRRRSAPNTLMLAPTSRVTPGVTPEVPPGDVTPGVTPGVPPVGITPGGVTSKASVYAAPQRLELQLKGVAAWVNARSSAAACRSSSAVAPLVPLVPLVPAGGSARSL